MTISHNDRLSLMPYRHHALAYGLRFDAATARFIPATRTLTAFERGIDDTASLPWAGAGYSTPVVPPNTDTTNCYRGGAFSITHSTMVLGITLVPSGTARIVRAADVTTHPTTPTFPRGGGAIVSDNEALTAFHGVFLDAALRTGTAELLPPGNNHSCSVFVGPLRFLIDAAGAIVWRPNVECFCEANRANITEFNPNRVQFKFSDAVESVPLLAGVAAPCDGDYAVLDFDLRVEFAHVEFNAAGDAYDGVSDVDKRKIAAWQDAFGSLREGRVGGYPVPAGTVAPASRSAPEREATGCPTCSGSRAVKRAPDRKSDAL